MVPQLVASSPTVFPMGSFSWSWDSDKVSSFVAKDGTSIGILLKHLNNAIQVWIMSANEFQWKVHEEQYHFNLEVTDHVSAAAKHLCKLQPTLEKHKATLKKARKELQEGTVALVECQKHIYMADHSEHTWEMLVAYKGKVLATDKEDAKRIEKAEKAAKQWVAKKNWKGAAATASLSAKRQALATGPQTHGSGQPSQYLLHRPLFQQQSTTCPVGPYFYCSVVGWLIY